MQRIMHTACLECPAYAEKKEKCWAVWAPVGETDLQMIYSVYCLHQDLGYSAVPGQWPT